MDCSTCWWLRRFVSEKSFYSKFPVKKAFQDCVRDLWSVGAMSSLLSTALTTKKTKRLKHYCGKYFWTIWFNFMIPIINSITSAGNANLATTRMVNYPMSNIWQKLFLSGDRVAVFGLHDFDKAKVKEWRKTGKSEYTIVPVIGGVLYEWWV